MMPTASTLNRRLGGTLSNVILPDLSSPTPKFQARISAALSEHLATRAEKEARALVDSNDEMRETIAAVADMLDKTAAKQCASKAREDLAAARQRDAYCSIDSLNAENVDLRTTLVYELKSLQDLESEIDDAVACAIRNRITSCAYHQLERDFDLVRNLAEFQTTLYNM